MITISLWFGQTLPLSYHICLCCSIRLVLLGEVGNGVIRYHLRRDTHIKVGAIRGESCNLGVSCPVHLWTPSTSILHLVYM